MGNYRFKLSDMMPNAWFYKLKDMKKPIPTSKKKQSPSSSTGTLQKQPKTDQLHHSHPRKSYYFARDHLVIPSLDNLRASPPSRAHLPSPPRKAKRKPNRSVTSTVSAGCSCRATATVDSVWSKPGSPAAFSSPSASESTDTELSPHSPIHEFRADPILATQSFDKMVSLSTSCQCKAIDSTANDKVSVSRKIMSFDSLEYDMVPEIDLPQIVTKPARFTDMVQSLKTKDDTVNPKSSSVKVVDQESVKVKEQRKTSSSSSSSTTTTTNTNTTINTTTNTTNKLSSNSSSNSSNRRFSVSSPSTRVKINSPRLGSRRIQGRKSVSSTSSSSSKSSSRRSLSVSDSFAVVKSSFDPQRDFRESMVEMIVQNNIRGSKGLEDLLACYLSLNSDEYHDTIIKVFKQIWFDLCDFQLN